MKNKIIQAGITVSPLYFKYVRLRFLRELWWNRVCRPYLCWRDLEVYCKTVHGFRIRCRLKDTLQAKIAFFGEWEPNLSAFISRRLAPGDGFIDIGANIGYYSLLAAERVGFQGLVLAIEASPSIYDLLCRNIELNDVANVRAINMAASSHEGVITVYKAGNDNIGGTTTLRDRGFQRETEVRCAPLASIATVEELRRARIIKIDIEGAEAPILEELSKNIDCLRKDVEIVAEISVDGCTAMSRTWKSVFHDFAALGFQAYELPNEYSDLAYLNRPSPIVPRRLEGLPRRQFDVVLSRQIADRL
jgi:FkbM family methyltransferase